MSFHSSCPERSRRILVAFKMAAGDGPALKYGRN
jgi:hypothetical protein